MLWWYVVLRLYPWPPDATGLTHQRECCRAARAVLQLLCGHAFNNPLSFTTPPLPGPLHAEPAATLAEAAAATPGTPAAPSCAASPASSPGGESLYGTAVSVLTRIPSCSSLSAYSGYHSALSVLSKVSAGSALSMPLAGGMDHSPGGRAAADAPGDGGAAELGCCSAAAGSGGAAATEAGCSAVGDASSGPGSGGMEAGCQAAGCGAEEAAVEEADDPLQAPADATQASNGAVDAPPNDHPLPGSGGSVAAGQGGSDGEEGSLLLRVEDSASSTPSKAQRARQAAEGGKVRGVTSRAGGGVGWTLCLLSGAVLCCVAAARDSLWYRHAGTPHRAGEARPCRSAMLALPPLLTCISSRPICPHSRLPPRCSAPHGLAKWATRERCWRCLVPPPP